MSNTDNRTLVGEEVDRHGVAVHVVGGLFDCAEEAVGHPAAMKVRRGSEAEGEGVFVDLRLEWFYPRLPGNRGDPVLKSILELLPECCRPLSFHCRRNPLH